MSKHSWEEILLCQKYLKEEHPSEDSNNLDLINSLLDDPKFGSVLKFFKKSISPSFPLVARSATGEDPNFLKEEKGRKNLEKIPNFAAGGAWDEWLAMALPLLHKEWPADVKMNILRTKFDTALQTRIDWERGDDPKMGWEKFLKTMRTLTSSNLGEVLKENSLRDLRQAPGQNFRSWTDAISAAHCAVFGEGPSQEKTKKILWRDSLPPGKIKKP